MPLLQNHVAARSFLAKELERISDADPEILADYILALLRHDKPANELREVCLDNLKDFLHDKTQIFVDRLFEYLVKGSEDSISSAQAQLNTGLPLPVASVEEARSRRAERSRSTEESERRRDRRPERERELSPGSRPYPRSRRQDYYNGPPRHFGRGMPPPFIPPPPMPFGVPPPFGMQTDRPVHIRRPPPLHKMEGSRSDTRLVVDRIPYEHCSISAINDYFQKFGSLVNVTVNPEQRRARIQYSTTDEAMKAYHSSEAIFDNRFVKLYWDREGEAIPEPTKGELPPKHVSADQSQPPSLHSTIQIASAKRKEALNTMLQLQRQQQELLTRYIDQQKELMSRLESGSVADEDKTEMMESLKNVDALIISMRESMQTVEAKLTEMQNPERSTSESASANSPISKPILRGGPSARGTRGGRGGRPADSYKLDMRPTSLLIRPIPMSVGRDINSLRRFFEPYGQIKGINVVEDSNAAIVQYQHRHEAEQVLCFVFS